MTTNANAGGVGDLRARRHRLGISAERLARFADCSTSTVRLAEQGWRPARGTVLPRIAAALDQLEADEMIGEDVIVRCVGNGQTAAGRDFVIHELEFPERT